MDKIDIIKQVIESINKKYIVDKSCKTIDEIMEKIKKSGIDVVICISKKVINNVDTINPERIACILVKIGATYVIPYNRDLNLQRLIPYWINKDVKEVRTNIECCICYSKRSKKNNFAFSQCPNCFCTMCVSCYHMTTHDEEFNCPLCRFHTLYGYGYGIPFEVGNYMKLNDEDSPVEKMMSILEKLDGLVEIIPRINEKLDIKSMMNVCKLCKSTKYSITSMTPKYIRKQLKHIVSRAKTGDIIKLYLIRQTCKIDTSVDKRINELSLFQIKDNQLWQYPVDAYINMFDEIIEQYHIPVEYIQPHIPVIPSILIELFNSINAEYQYTKTFSVVADNGLGNCNFDVDETGKITSANKNLIASYIENITTKYHITCRVSAYEDENNADVILYRIDNDTLTKLDSVENKRFYKKNYDRLKKSKHIVQFL